MGTHTHTYAILEISMKAYQEIKEKLEAAGYADQFHDRAEDLENPIIDMHGIAVAPRIEDPEDHHDR